MDDYHLTRNDFNQSASNALKGLIETKTFADVTLACADDKQIMAHRVILASSSIFFKNIFTNNPHQHPLLYLKGVNFEDLEAIVKFIYAGETNVAQASLDNFLAAAQELQVHGLLVDLDVKLNKKSPLTPPNEGQSLAKEETVWDDQSAQESKSLNEEGTLPQIELDNQRFNCDDCAFVSNYSYSLTRHRVKVHTVHEAKNSNTWMSKPPDKGLKSELMLRENYEKPYGVDDSALSPDLTQHGGSFEEKYNNYPYIENRDNERPKYYYNKCEFRTKHGWNLTRHKKSVCNKKD